MNLKEGLKLEIDEFCVSAGSKPDAVIDIAEKKLESGARIRLKQGLFRVIQRQAQLNPMASLLT